MLRKFAVGLAALGALNAAQVKALGLGEVTVHSALNQPLEAEIDLLQTRDLSASQIIAGLADTDEFYLAGVKPTAVLSDIRFELEIQEKGGKIYLSTREPIREPFLNFLVEVNWPSGRLVREYTVLLDPPVFTAKDLAPRAVPLPPTAAAPLEQPVKPALDVPAETTPAPQAASVADEYRVGKHDTLWSIALKTRPESSITPQQMMLALQKTNPDAFIDNNINRLKSGAVLRIPSAEQVAILGRQESIEEVKRQNVAWRGEGEQQEASAQGESLDAVAASEAAEGDAGEAEESRLRIVSQPEEPESAVEEPAEPVVADEAQASDSGAEAVEQELLTKNRELEEQLVVTLEGLDKVERDNAEMFQRLEQLGEQMASMQRLLELKDQQLATLQAELREAQTQPAPEPAGALQKLMNTPAVLFGGLGALVALLAGGLLLARKRKAQEEQDVEAAMAELDSREQEEANERTASDTKVVAGAAAASAAVAAAQAGQDDEPEDPFDIATEEIADDEFDSLTSEDLEASLGDDLDMDLRIDEPVEEDPEMAEFAESLLSDDEYDLSVDESAGDEIEPAVDDDALESSLHSEEDDDLDFVLADSASSSLERVDSAEEAEEVESLGDLDSFFGASDAAENALEAEAASSGDDDGQVLDELDDILGGGGDASVEASAEVAEVADDFETIASEVVTEQAEEEDVDLLGGLDDILGESDSAGAVEPEGSEEVTEEAGEEVLPDAAEAGIEAELDELLEQAGEQKLQDQELQDQQLTADVVSEGGLEVESTAFPDAAEAESEADLDALFASFDSGAEEQGGAQEEMAGHDETPAAEEGFTLQLDDDDVEAAPEASAEPVAPLEVIEEAPTASGLQLEDDFDGAEERDLEAELNQMLEQEGNALSLEETSLEEGGTETDYLEGADEVGTKLDLARAYIDMDDSDGARDILQEVIREGSAEQVEEAKEMLAALK
ncbi:FimV/HubP family polar landmark protein [Motiliproteus sp. SC1-56]|uniref:FimV/HubP family polar landmark protein n=1 Tax=Motiliproteus sp. SC1-56 TaxID=2799565 RepID=UPI001A90BDDE|nr:FimV/HubP family polar landmark protein [Motiliproteus sp. SC1-56]